MYLWFANQHSTVLDCLHVQRCPEQYYYCESPGTVQNNCAKNENSLKLLQGGSSYHHRYCLSFSVLMLTGFSRDGTSQKLVSCPFSLSVSLGCPHFCAVFSYGHRKGTPPVAEIAHFFFFNTYISTFLVQLEPAAHPHGFHQL